MKNTDFIKDPVEWIVCKLDLEKSSLIVERKISVPKKWSEENKHKMFFVNRNKIRVPNIFTYNEMVDNKPKIEVEIVK